MTREEAKRILPIMQAYADGKTIEMLCYNDEWKKVDEPSFKVDPKYYRIKQNQNIDHLRHKKSAGMKCTIILILVG